MSCPKVTVRTRNADGTEQEEALEDALDRAESEATEPEDWNEVERETEEVEVDGVKIDRIIRVTFEKPSGKRVRLNFAEALD